MNKLTVIGIGNRLMMDDGIGVFVVENLIEQNNSEDINYIVGETDIDYSLSQIEKEDYLIVIDAMILGKETGEVTVINLNEVSHLEQLVSSHDLHLFNVINLEQLKGVVIGIEPSEIIYSYGLSNKLTEQFTNILVKVKVFISIIENNYIKNL